ncbi:hypothetical protein BJY59DRAFT_77603 [Rhodotorula toruloides]
MPDFRRAATLERLLLANVAVAHDNTVDHVQLSTLRNLVMSNCTAIVDADPTLRQLIAAATPTADTFRRFLSRMSSLRQLELFDHKYLAADLGMLGPSCVKVSQPWPLETGRPASSTVTCAWQTSAPSQSSTKPSLGLCPGRTSRFASLAHKSSI